MHLCLPKVLRNALQAMKRKEGVTFLPAKQQSETTADIFKTRRMR